MLLMAMMALGCGPSDGGWCAPPTPLPRCLLVAETRTPQDPTFETEVVNGYDDDGNLIVTETTTGGTTAITTRQYDACGSIEVFEQRDRFGDFSIRTSWTYLPDAQGDLLETTGDTSLIDRNGSNIPLRQSRFAGPERNLVELLENTDAFDTFDQRTVLDYDDAGRVIRTSVDQRIDGLFDQVTIHAYELDDQGRVVRQTWRAESTTALSRVEEFAYDEDGNVTLYVIDNDADGRVDYAERTTYGVGTVTLEVDANGDGTPEIVEVTTFDADGRVVTVAQGDLVLTHTYDALGNRVESVETEDGEVTLRTTFDWDCDPPLDQ